MRDGIDLKLEKRIDLVKRDMGYDGVWWCDECNEMGILFVCDDEFSNHFNTGQKRHITLHVSADEVEGALKIEKLVGVYVCVGDKIRYVITREFGRWLPDGPCWLYFS